MTEKKGTFHMFLSCEDDVIVDTQTIELFLNKLMPQGCTNKCIKKHKNIKQAKKDLSDLKESSIYVVDTHKGLDNVSFWELGYAMGSGLEVIGYYDGRSEIKVPKEVKELIGTDEATDDLESFVENIRRIFAAEKKKPLEYVMEQWNGQLGPSKRQG
jgi:nucleoside 2-deoxyribosyltransferase